MIMWGPSQRCKEGLTPADQQRDRHSNRMKEGQEAQDPLSRVEEAREETQHLSCQKREGTECRRSTQSEPFTVSRQLVP